MYVEYDQVIFQLTIRNILCKTGPFDGNVVKLTALISLSQSTNNPITTKSDYT